MSTPNDSSKPAFTPGPWRYHGDSHSLNWVVELRKGKQRREIVVEGFSDLEAHANAHLIAAAPDLFAALHKITTTPVSPSEHNGATKALISVAKEAIAKAEGR